VCAPSNCPAALASQTRASALSGVQTINLSCCSGITDEGVKALAGVHTIQLSGCARITDEGVKALTGVHNILLPGCALIIDEGGPEGGGGYDHQLPVRLQTHHPRGCEGAGERACIDLQCTPQVTVEALKALTGVRFVVLGSCCFTEEPVPTSLCSARAHVQAALQSISPAHMLRFSATFSAVKITFNPKTLKMRRTNRSASSSS